MLDVIKQLNSLLSGSRTYIIAAIGLLVSAIVTVFISPETGASIAGAFVLVAQFFGRKGTAKVDAKVTEVGIIAAEAKNNTDALRALLAQAALESQRLKEAQEAETKAKANDNASAIFKDNDIPQEAEEKPEATK